jgi:hypothetical protein
LRFVCGADFTARRIAPHLLAAFRRQSAVPAQSGEISAQAEGGRG